MQYRSQLKIIVIYLGSRPGLLEAWLALTSVKYRGNLWVLTPLTQRLAQTRLRATAPRSLATLRYMRIVNLLLFFLLQKSIK